MKRMIEVSKRLEQITNPVVIEVGVNHGRFSERMLQHREDLTLYMVDNWLGATEQPEAYVKTGDKCASRNEETANKAFQSAQRVQRRYKDRCHLIRGNSVDVAAHFPSGFADLIFIDGDHSYEGCKADILAYYPKTRRWIGGHDYKNKHPKMDFSGVDRAVEEIFDEFQEGKGVTWWVDIEW